MSRPKRKGYTVRQRNDCNRWELIIHPDLRLGIPMTYGGLYKTEEEADREGRRLMLVSVDTKKDDGKVPW